MSIRRSGSYEPLVEDKPWFNGTGPMLDLATGGQYGHQPNYDTYISASPFARQNIIPVLLDAPRGMKYHSRSKEILAVLKHLMEVQPLSIEGLAAGLTVNTTEIPFGGSGEVLEEPTNVTRERSNLSYTFQERENRAISSFIEWWITEFIMVPESKIAGYTYGEGNDLTDRLADFRGATMMYIEPDKTHRRIVRAWLGTNIYPKTTGPIEGARNMTNDLETPQLNVPFSGLFQHGRGVNDLAQELLSAISYTNANPNNRQAFIDGINKEVLSAGIGYQSLVEEEAATSL